MKHDRAEIERALNTLCTGVVEIRALGVDGRKNLTSVGYFDDYAKAAECAATTKASGIYFTLNELDKSLLARAANRMKTSAVSTADANITRRRWMLVDLDAERPAGISATDAEKEAALAKAREIYGYLQRCGFENPVVADSGNGAHLLYRIDLPSESDLVERILKHLAAEFDDPSVNVDTSVFNPARITKLYGTIAAKGDDTPDRPHRASSLLSIPETIKTTPEAKCAKLAARLVEMQPAYVSRPNGSEFDVVGFLRSNGLEFEERGHKDGTKYVLSQCPFNPDHKAPDSAVFVTSSGFGFKCFHNSCQGNDWKKFRQLFEPEAYDRRPYQPRQEPKPPARKAKENTLEAAVYRKIDKLGEQSEELRSLGIDELDYAIGGGFEQHEVILCGARPSHGKSAFALQCCQHAALDAPALFISEEMSSDSLAKRALQRASNVPTEHWLTRKGMLREDAQQHFKALQPIYVEESLRTVENVGSVIRDHVNKNGVRFVAVDYAQLLKSSGKSRFDNVTHTSIELRRIANECDVSMLVLCQLSRAIESRDSFVPKLSDLRESGQLEQDADVIVFLVWPHRIDGKNDPGEYKIYVAKNRNRAINQFVVNCEFNPSRQLLTEEPAKRMENYEPAFEDF